MEEQYEHWHLRWLPRAQLGVVVLSSLEVLTFVMIVRRMSQTFVDGKSGSQKNKFPMIHISGLMVAIAALLVAIASWQVMTNHRISREACAFVFRFIGFAYVFVHYLLNLLLVAKVRKLRKSLQKSLKELELLVLVCTNGLPALALAWILLWPSDVRGTLFVSPDNKVRVCVMTVDTWLAVMFAWAQFMLAYMYLNMFVSPLEQHMDSMNSTSSRIRPSSSMARHGQADRNHVEELQGVVNRTVNVCKIGAVSTLSTVIAVAATSFTTYRNVAVVLSGIDLVVHTGAFAYLISPWMRDKVSVIKKEIPKRAGMALSKVVPAGAGTHAPNATEMGDFQDLLPTTIGERQIIPN